MLFDFFLFVGLWDMHWLQLCRRTEGCRLNNSQATLRITATLRIIACQRSCYGEKVSLLREEDEEREKFRVTPRFSNLDDWVEMVNIEGGAGQILLPYSHVLRGAPCIFSFFSSLIPWPPNNSESSSGSNSSGSGAYRHIRCCGRGGFLSDQRSCGFKWVGQILVAFTLFLSSCSMALELRVDMNLHSPAEQGGEGLGNQKVLVSSSRKGTLNWTNMDLIPNSVLTTHP